MESHEIISGTKLKLHALIEVVHVCQQDYNERKRTPHQHCMLVFMLLISGQYSIVLQETEMSPFSLVYLFVY